MIAIHLSEYIVRQKQICIFSRAEGYGMVSVMPLRTAALFRRMKKPTKLQFLVVGPIQGPNYTPRYNFAAMFDGF